MTVPKVTLLTSSFLLLAGALGTLAAQSGAAREFEERVDSLMTAYGRADAKTVASFYAPNAAVLTGGTLLSGEQIISALEHHFSQLVTQDFDLDFRDTRFITDGYAVTSVAGRTQGRNAMGEVIFSGAIVVSIHWRRDEGRWWIVYAQEDFRAG